MSAYLGFLSFSSVAEEFIVGVENVPYYPLFDFSNERSTYTRDLLDEFARQNGHTFKYLPLPIKRFDKWLLEHNIDFKYPDNVRWFGDKSVRKQMVFSGPTLQLIAGIVTLKKSNINKREQIKTVGTLLGFSPTLWQQDIESGRVKLVESSSTLVLLKQLLHGHIDGLNIDLGVANQYLAFLGSEEELVLNKNIHHQMFEYHLSTIKHPKVILQFDRFLKDNKLFLEKLRLKYQLVDYRDYLNTENDKK